MGIGAQIKKRREYLGISQDELAKKLGYKSRSSINKIEKGINDISQSKIVSFANALDTSVEYLLNWEENVEPIKRVNPLIEELTEKASHLSDDQLKQVIAIVDTFKTQKKGP